MPGHKLFAALSGLILGLVASIASAAPTFTASVAPSTNYSGALSTVTYTITEVDGVGVTDIEFSHDLISGFTYFGTPSTTCSDGFLSAPSGGTSLTLTGGRLAPNASCTVTAKIIVGAVAGANLQTSGALTSSAGSSGTANYTVTVEAAPATTLSLALAPSTIAANHRTTATFSISGTSFYLVTTTMALPLGVTVATPSNLSNDCPYVSTLTAPAGGSLINLSQIGSLSAGSCSISFDLVGATSGTYFLQTEAVSGTSGGPASATLVVSPSGATGVELSKRFTAGSALPGATTPLEFTLRNLDRGADATGLASRTIWTRCSAVRCPAAWPATPAAGPCREPRPFRSAVWT
jgi:hypothetical protein